MFHRLFMLVVFSGVFTGGYYLGRRPDSPDLIGWVRSAYHRVAGTAGALSDMVDSADAGELKEPSEQPKPSQDPQYQTTYTINGQTYVISRKPPES